MTLKPGSRVGPYEVVAPLGAGGMGEVYRARDNRRGRTVAIKILRQDAVADPARVDRFEREARAASALNHPNIVTIYDVGVVDSTSYIAMEWIDGASLRDIERGLASGYRGIRRSNAIRFFTTSVESSGSRPC
jgi:serine/threonine protein kinase